jgi:serpin B
VRRSQRAVEAEDDGRVLLTGRAQESNAALVADMSPPHRARTASLRLTLVIRVTAMDPAAITPRPSSPVTTAERADDARGERVLAAQLYAALARDSTRNLALSPSSARMALTMTAAGARGETLRELEHVLGASSLDAAARVHDVAAVVASEWAALATPSETRLGKQAIVLRTANRLFARQGSSLQPGFVELTRSRYGAPVEAVDFAHDEARTRAAINAWIERQTESRIRNLLSATLPPETKLVLVNAIYLRATWERDFPEHRTTSEPFYGPLGTKNVATMHQTELLRFGETPEAQIVELAYGGHGRTDIAMLLVVPKARDGLALLEHSMSGEQLALWARAASREIEVDLALPKFRIESAHELGETIAALGARTAFVYPDADFSGIDGTRELFLGLVLQKAFVEIDERGTEAAAATAAVLAMGAPAMSRPRERVVVRADRPFLFVIRDRVRDRVVFLGRVVDPSTR